LVSISLTPVTSKWGGTFRAQLLRLIFIRSDSFTNNDQIWHDNQCRRDVFYGVNCAPHPTKRGPSFPKFWNPSVRRYRLTYSDQIRHNNQFRGRGVFLGTSYAPFPRKRSPRAPTFGGTPSLRHAV